MKFYAYVLISESTGQHYTGQSNDLLRRVEAHNLGNSKSTRNRGPWKLEYFEECSSRAEAMKREKFLKTGKGREFLRTMIDTK